MSQNLHQAGKKLLRALSKHADLIMQTYLAGALDESKTTPGDIDKLINLGIIWRPEANAELRLRRVIRSLLEEGLSDERNRQLDANVGSTLASLKTITAHYKEAKSKWRHSEAEAYLADLTEQVYSLTESLKHNVRVLWERIHKEFGYVASIDAKIRENELAQSQVSELLTQLEMFQFDQLSELSASDRDLRRLLVVTLQGTFADVSRELSLVQAKLIELLGRFREFQGKTRLLKGFLLHMEQKPDYQPVQYALHSEVPRLFNQAAATLKPATANVNNTAHEVDLLQLVGRLKALQHLHTEQKPDRVAQTVEYNEQEEVALLDNQIRAQVENYFCHIIDSGQSLSALQYYQQEQLEFDQEIWLYQVLGGYQGLSEEEKQYFALDTETIQHPVYCGNQLIQDLSLWLR